LPCDPRELPGGIVPSMDGPVPFGTLDYLYMPSH